ncbi:DUF3631 domain-containing protein [Kocuria rhizophila]|uniref:DUF3631 domain-containing protein n=1 Tax=Kocuria rhizophila TaxID=72000 RepID=UPI001EF69644|nr:DUF3631 domain-containing protein [Kocuria rhizophila]
MNTDLNSALDRLRGWLARFVVVTEDRDLDTLTLWAAHTWALDLTATTPRLLIDSTTHGSGKTTLMEHLNAMCKKPLLAASLGSPALLTRLVAEEPRTILVDEVDRVLDPKRDGVGELMAVINAGYKRGSTRPVLVPSGGDWVPREFPTYAPVAMAGNAPLLPDDTRSRCIRVLLMPDFNGQAEDTDWEELDAEATELREHLTAAVEQARDLIAVKPPLPEGCRGRMAEKWRPLARIAHAAGPGWAQKVDDAARQDMTEAEQDREDGMTTDRPAVVLLKHLAELWPEGKTFETTRRLVDDLVFNYPETWGATSGYGKELTAQRMGRLLSQGFKIHASKVNGVRGYKRAALVTAWTRFGLTPSVQTVQTGRTVQTDPEPVAVDGLDGSPRTAHELDRRSVVPSQSRFVDGLDGSDGSDGSPGKGGGGPSSFCGRGMCSAPPMDGSDYCAHHAGEVAA